MSEPDGSRLVLIALSGADRRFRAFYGPPPALQERRVDEMGFIESGVLVTFDMNGQPRSRFLPFSAAEAAARPPSELHFTCL